MTDREVEYPIYARSLLYIIMIMRTCVFTISNRTNKL